MVSTQNSQTTAYTGVYSALNQSLSLIFYLKKSSLISPFFPAVTQSHCSVIALETHVGLIYHLAGQLLPVPVLWFEWGNGQREQESNRNVHQAPGFIRCAHRKGLSNSSHSIDFIGNINYTVDI